MQQRWSTYVRYATKVKYICQVHMWDMQQMWGTCVRSGTKVKHMCQVWYVGYLDYIYIYLHGYTFFSSRLLILFFYLIIF